MIKIWIDDIRTPPSKEWIWLKSVNAAKRFIAYKSSLGGFDMLLSVDHDAGDYASDGGDYIKILDWLEETGRNYPIHIHSMNPVGAANMRAIIKRNGWREV
jgi:hypothetical protein